MGKLIDVDEVKKRYPIMENDFGMVVNERLHKELDEIPPVEAIPKDQYEARLKADMLSMLYKLRSEIINMPKYFPYADHTRWFIDGDVFGLIDKKINALKENEDERD